MEKLEFNKFIFKDKSPKLEILDEFCEYYGWEVFKHDYYYILYDNQSGEIVDHFEDFYDLVIRVSSRALDYYCEEEEYDDFTMTDYKYIMQFIFVYESYYHNQSDTRNDWLKSKKQWLKDMEVF